MVLPNYMERLLPSWPSALGKTPLPSDSPEACSPTRDRVCVRVRVHAHAGVEWWLYCMGCSTAWPCLARLDLISPLSLPVG